MGLHSHLHNVKGNSMSRPPLIIFVICLFICASAMIGVGLFIQYSEAVANPEVKEKWLKFLDRISAQKYCLSVSETDKNVDPGSITQFIDGGPLNSTNERHNETSLTVSGSIRVTKPLKTTGGTVAAYGDIPLGEWATILNVDHPLKTIRMTFGFPSKVLNVDNVCLILTVPTWFLPESSRATVCVPTFINETITAVGTLEVSTHTMADVNGNSFCETGSQMTLSFNSEEEFYLSNIEKLNIYFRLVHAGYFFFALSFLLICLSTVPRRGYKAVVTNERVPLSL